MHPYYNQEICHIMTHLQESKNGSQTGLLLLGTAEAFWLEMCLPFSLGSTDCKIWSAYTTDYWYKHLLQFVERNPIDIVEDFLDVPLLRDGDSYLMQAFIDAGFRGSQLKRLNVMRMELQAVTVADIATPDGRRLTHNAFLLRSSNGLRIIYDWPQTPPMVNFPKNIFVCGKMPCSNHLPSLKTVSPVVPYFFVIGLVPGATHLSWISGNGLNPQLNNSCING